MFLTSFNIYFCLVMHVLLNVYPIFLRTAIWFILAFLRQGLPFLVNLDACRRLVMAAESC